MFRPTTTITVLPHMSTPGQTHTAYKNTQPQKHIAVTIDRRTTLNASTTEMQIQTVSSADKQLDLLLSNVGLPDF